MQSVHCPSCDTSYGLKLARIRPGLRRARCYRCTTVFGIEAEVMLLLGGSSFSAKENSAPPVAAGVVAPLEEDFFPAQLDVFEEFDASTLEVFEDLAPPRSLEQPVALDTLEPLEVLSADSELELPSLEELEAATAAIDPLAAETALGDFGEVLSADDLAGAEDEILDKTLVDFVAPPHPEARPTPSAPIPAPSINELEDEPTTTLGGYSSAKDAISKLLGETPPPAAAYRPPSHRNSTNMDVEATLSALENTLGGNSASLPSQLRPEPVMALDAADLPAPAGATMQLNREEVAAAIALMGAAPPPPPPPQRPALSEATVMLKMSVSDPPHPSMDPNLLKVQMGTELYSNLSMEQLTSLAEQGRLAEYHMVARQFSDNWLEASKVPGLRPVFERLRKARLPEPPSSPLETAPIKKSLFGGLFGKN